jgi:hypothetical protein
MDGPAAARQESRWCEWGGCDEHVAVLVASPLLLVPHVGVAERLRAPTWAPRWNRNMTSERGLDAVNLLLILRAGDREPQERLQKYPRRAEFSDHSLDPTEPALPRAFPASGSRACGCRGFIDAHREITMLESRSALADRDCHGRPQENIVNVSQDNMPMTNHFASSTSNLLDSISARLERDLVSRILIRSRTRWFAFCERNRDAPSISR